TRGTRIPSTRSSGLRDRGSVCSNGTDGDRRGEPLCEVAERDGVAVLDPAVLPVEELEEDVGDADSLQCGAEGLGAQVEVVLVAVARVDVDRAEPAKDFRVVGNHPDRVPREPAIPDLGPEAAGLWIEGGANGSIRVARVAGAQPPPVRHVGVAALRERGPGAEVLPEALVRAAVVVSESPCDL